MAKPKRVKAGIVDIEEAKQRLMAGEIFYYYSGRLHYDASFILLGESPFRYESVSIISCWYYVEMWRKEVEADDLFLGTTVVMKVRECDRRMEEFLNMSLGGDASFNKPL